jgi:hypothetical protein
MGGKPPRRKGENHERSLSPREALEGSYINPVRTSVMPKQVELMEIRSILDPLPGKSLGWTARQWTNSIKEGLIKLATDHGCKACASGCMTANWPEWLYDVTWLRQGDGENNGFLTHSPFVAEIEWSNKGAVMDDFQKLLLARADTKLMIFAKYSTDRGEPLMERLIKQIQVYARTDVGDRYFLVCMDCRSDKSYKFHYREYVHQLDDCHRNQCGHPRSA